MMGLGFGGMLAAGLGGLAGTLNEQASGDIKQQRDIETAQQRAAIEEQMRMRIAEHAEQLRIKGMTATRDFNSSDETLAANDKVAKAAGKTAAEVRTATLSNEGLNAAERNKAAGDTAAATASEMASTQAKAASKPYLDAVRQMKLADPEVVSRINSAAASAGLAAAQTRMVGQQLKEMQQVSDVAAQVRAIQALLSTEDDPKQRAKLQTQASDLLGQTKSPMQFLEQVNRFQDNARDALKLLATPGLDEATTRRALQQLDEAHSWAKAAAKMGNLEIGSDDAPVIPQAAIDELLKNPKTAAQFDSAFKKPGLAAQLIEANKPSKPATVTGGTGLLAAPPPASTEQRIAKIERRLSDDDYIKSSAGGSAARAIERRAMPLGIAERRDLENQLSQLKAKR